MINKIERLVLKYLGKCLELACFGLIVVIMFLDPIRGRLCEWDWLQSLAMACGIVILVFSVWLDKFLNALRKIIDEDIK
jgi:hypothetical protein